MRFIKKLKTLKESLIGNRIGEIYKERKIVIFLLSSFGHTEIEYFADSHDEVRPLLSKEVREVLLIQKRHKP